MLEPLVWGYAVIKKQIFNLSLQNSRAAEVGEVIEQDDPRAAMPRSPRTAIEESLVELVGAEDQARQLAEKLNKERTPQEVGVTEPITTYEVKEAVSISGKVIF